MKKLIVLTVFLFACGGEDKLTPVDPPPEGAGSGEVDTHGKCWQAKDGCLRCVLITETADLKMITIKKCPHD